MSYPSPSTDNLRSYRSRMNSLGLFKTFYILDFGHLYTLINLTEFYPLNWYGHLRCPQVDLGRICAQPETDLMKSGGAKSHPPPTAREDRSSGSDLQWVADGLVGIIDLRKWRENGEKNPNPIKMSSKSMRFPQIWQKSHWAQ